MKHTITTAVEHCKYNNLNLYTDIRRVVHASDLIWQGHICKSSHFTPVTQDILKPPMHVQYSVVLWAFTFAVAQNYTVFP